MKLYKKTFSDEEVAEFKRITENKNALLSYNNIEKEFDTRWIGTPCELAFREFLQANKIIHQYWTKDNKIDDRDFTIFGNIKLEIDVKGTATKYYPREDYACNIIQKQWDKLMELGNIVDTFVFARYLLLENTALILGAISKEDLRGKAEYFSVGTKRGSIELSTNTYEIPISELTPVEIFFAKDYGSNIL